MPLYCAYIYISVVEFAVKLKLLEPCNYTRSRHPLDAFELDWSKLILYQSGILNSRWQTYMQEKKWRQLDSGIKGGFEDAK